MRIFLLFIFLSTVTLANESQALAEREIDEQLDRFHQQASLAQGREYFAHFAPEAVFLGTDISERWTLEEFKAYAMPFFEQGKGWTYTPQKRYITLSPQGGTAWFDEILKSENYGATRGSGVLVKLDGEWKISQYHLTVPIPNALLFEVVKMIEEHSDGKDGSLSVSQGLTSSSPVVQTDH